MFQKEMGIWIKNLGTNIYPPRLVYSAPLPRVDLFSFVV